MKRPVNSLLSALVVLLAFSLTAAAQGGTQPLTVAEMLKLRRVADPQLSPDGRWIAFQMTVPDVAANRNRTQLYLVSIDGGEPKQLTSGAANATTPRWSPDGRRLAYVTGGQIHAFDTASWQSKQITNISTGAGDPVWSPDGRLIAFVSDVYPDCADDECNKRRAQQAEENKVKARTIDRLLYRHWTAWKDGKRTHVFVVSSEGGAARDLTPGDFDAPPFSLGGPTDYAFSPDSKELAFARNTDKVEATSTNNDIFVVPVAGGEAKRITGANRGSDQSPQYSPDGRFIAYRSQERAGFEADRWRLMLYDRQAGTSREVITGFDNFVESFRFSPDGKFVYFTSGERGRHPVFVAPTDTGRAVKLIEGFNDDLNLSKDGRTLVFSRTSATAPTEIYKVTLTSAATAGPVTQVTRANDAALAKFYLPPAEELTWAGAGGTRIAGWRFKPINFQPNKKYPLLVLIHGGPQGAWNDAWSYRWNPQIYASAGYMVFMPNPRGSTGFGQTFVDEISADWAGKVYEDIMTGVAHTIAQGNVDESRIGAAGASYGGYMVNWILGHNDDPRARFKALVSHAGVYNLASMYGVTEELWFVEWEFKGAPWENPELYDRLSPHMYVKNFKTPTLVTHGEMDFRVPIDQGLQLFTALQKQGVDSRLLYFPDEGHWILKPANSEHWYGAVLAWLGKYLQPGQTAAAGAGSTR
ncbi:MAG TPA: S9 family peptidase [Pyrinomonadaceae bacterium]|nr:S9 family peptidase [Pyrinomonadaceae bacterium]